MQIFHIGLTLKNNFAAADHTQKIRAVQFAHCYVMIMMMAHITEQWAVSTQPSPVKNYKRAKEANQTTIQFFFVLSTSKNVTESMQPFLFFSFLYSHHGPFETTKQPVFTTTTFYREQLCKLLTWELVTPIYLRAQFAYC